MAVSSGYRQALQSAIRTIICLGVIWLSQSLSAQFDGALIAPQLPQRFGTPMPGNGAGSSPR